MIINVVISYMITKLDVTNPLWIAYGLPAECLRIAYRLRIADAAPIINPCRTRAVGCDHSPMDCLRIACAMPTDCPPIAPELDSLNRSLRME